MKIVILCLVVLSVVSGRVVVEVKRQNCGNHCTMNNLSGCPYGSLCFYNGCGHECKPFPFDLERRAMCLGAMCNSYCPHGHQLSADGCPTCACRPDPAA